MNEPLIQETEYSKMFYTSGFHRQIKIVPEPKVDPTYPAPPETPFFIVEEVAPSEYYPLGICTVTMYEFRDWKPWHKKKGMVRARYKKTTLYHVALQLEGIIENLLSGNYSARGLTPYARGQERETLPGLAFRPFLSDTTRDGGS
jgi:hypothetical protein